MCCMFKEWQIHKLIINRLIGNDDYYSNDNPDRALGGLSEIICSLLIGITNQILVLNGIQDKM